MLCEFRTNSLVVPPNEVGRIGLALSLAPFASEVLYALNVFCKHSFYRNKLGWVAELEW